MFTRHKSDRQSGLKHPEYGVRDLPSSTVRDAATAEGAPRACLVYPLWPDQKIAMKEAALSVIPDARREVCQGNVSIIVALKREVPLREKKIRAERSAGRGDCTFNMTEVP